MSNAFPPLNPRSPARPARDPSSFDQPVIQRIEAARGKHGKFRDIRVRALADASRLRREEDEAAREISARYGVSGVDELRTHVVAERERVSVEVSAYEAELAVIGEALAAHGESV